MKRFFWIETSDTYDRTAEEIADQDMTYLPDLDIGCWTVTLGGEPAVVLDGVRGQELQRRMYIARQQTLYVLAFWTARSENKAASDQMKVMYAAVTNSWAWSLFRTGVESTAVSVLSLSGVRNEPQLGILSYPHAKCHSICSGKGSHFGDRGDDQ